MREADVSSKSIEVSKWRLPTIEERKQFHSRPREHEEQSTKPSTLAVRTHLTPVDMYCYLKARFGEPNGMQAQLFRNKKTSDNLVHWDYLLKAANDANVYISSMSREIHFVFWEQFSDENWRDLILAIKADYGRVGKEKGAVLKSLEQWVLFPNKFVEVADLCAEHHAEIIDNMGGFRAYRTASAQAGEQANPRFEAVKQLGDRAAKLSKPCLQLSLLTPVLAETFINMVILILCKPEIRNNTRQLEAFVRGHIDTKLFDLSYKCVGFQRAIDPHSEVYKNFKRVMDKRNNAIHGNRDPEKEMIETVYFEGTCPLFKEPGDHLGKFFDALERQHDPETVIKDYECIHAFLHEILSCITPELAKGVERIMEDPNPGYDVNRKKVGSLLPHHVVMTAMEAQRYDDELNVVWK